MAFALDVKKLATTTVSVKSRLSIQIMLETMAIEHELFA